MAEKSKKIVQIEIETNAGKATKEFEQLSNGVLKAADSAEKLDASFDDVYNGMAPLTTRMGEAEDRLYELALAGDTASKEYQELLTKVGEYRKVQIQTDLAVDGAATTIGQKLGSALNGATSGFAATQGAMALFGSENDALEKSLLKVQSALAIQQGVDGLRTSYKELGGKTGIATKAQAAFNFVMNLNPIILIVTGITLAIAALLKFTSVLDPAIQSLKDFGDAIGLTNFAEENMAEKREERAVANEKRLEKEIENLKEIRANLDKNYQAYQKQLNAEIVALKQSKESLKNKEEIAAIDEQIRAKTIEGIEEEYKTFKEGEQLKLDGYEKEIKRNQARIDAAKARGSSAYKTELFYVQKYTAEANKLRNELNTNNFTQYQEYINKLEAVDIEKAKKEEADQKASNDRYKQYLQDRLSIARQIEDIENSLLEDGIEKELEINRDKFRKLREDVKGNREERKILTDLYNQQEAQAEAKIIADNQKRREDAFETERSERVELLNFVDELNTAEVESEKAKNLAILDNAVETNEKLIESDKAVAEAKKNIQDAQIANIEAGISLLKDVAGENNKLQALAIAAESAVSIAKTIITTQAANAAATAQGAALGITTAGASVAAATALVTQNNISAGISIAAQIAAAAKGISALGGGASAPSGGNLGGGGASSAAVPNFNVVGDSGINQIAQLQQQPVQAFVVSGEVTTSQALDRNRVQNATL